MKILLLLAFISLNHITGPKPTMVYICGSHNAKKYHQTPNCRGLNNCQFKIIKTTLTAAKSKGMTLCKWEH